VASDEIAGFGPQDGSSGASRYRRSDDVAFRRLGERMVLIHLTTNQIYELNQTAARLWELLDDVEISKLEEALLAEFAVDRPTLRREISKTIAELHRERLVVTE
jgi:hypothetical protein